MKTKSIARFLSLAVASGLLMTMLVGCLDNDSQTKQDVSSTVSETAADTGRKDGERFEDVIILEGEEETGVGAKVLVEFAYYLDLDSALAEIILEL